MEQNIIQQWDKKSQSSQLSSAQQQYEYIIKVSGSDNPLQISLPQDYFLTGNKLFQIIHYDVTLTKTIDGTLPQFPTSISMHCDNASGCYNKTGKITDMLEYAVPRETTFYTSGANSYLEKQYKNRDAELDKEQISVPYSQSAKISFYCNYTQSIGSKLLYSDNLFNYSNYTLTIRVLNAE